MLEGLLLTYVYLGAAVDELLSHSLRLLLSTGARYECFSTAISSVSTSAKIFLVFSSFFLFIRAWVRLLCSLSFAWFFLAAGDEFDD